MKVIKSPFSCAVHALPKTLWQLRVNHFSTFSASVNRSGVLETAIGATSLPALVCPAFVGSAVWHVVQDGVSAEVSCFAKKNALPRSAEKPENAEFSALAAAK
jgi:hypothetical protein